VLGQPSSLNATNCAVKQTLHESDRAVDAAGVNGYATLTPGWPDDPDPGFSAHPWRRSTEQLSESLAP
jgi:hypothetical protein